MESGGNTNLRTFQPQGLRRPMSIVKIVKDRSGAGQALSVLEPDVGQTRLSGSEGGKCSNTSTYPKINIFWEYRHFAGANRLSLNLLLAGCHCTQWKSFSGML